MRDGQEAARRHQRAERAHAVQRVILARYEMQDRDEQDAGRPAKVDRLPQAITGENLPRAADILVHHRDTVSAAGQQRPVTPGHHRVIVDIDHPRPVHQRRRRLMHARRSSKAGTQVNELPDALGSKRSCVL